nr:MAG: ORF1 [TTV-like mini virus]
MPLWYRYKRNPNRFYWRNRRRKYWTRRKSRFRRPRKAFRRRWNFRRAYYRVRKKLLKKKKLPYLIVKEFQPQTIKKCKVRGSMCLFQCGPNRLHYNYTQYMNSYTPEYWEGGGGWSQLKFTLSSLYEQREYLRNKWTTSNVALPLVRYTGCKFKFWRMWDIDYIVYYSNCLPMLDTVYQHVNAQPYNMMLYKHKVIVKSQRSTPKSKPFKRLKIKPPEQFTNQWYFQADFATHGLVLLTTSAMDLNRMYLNPKAISSSITLNCLNTKLFANHNFKQYNMGTALWSPANDKYYYITDNGHTTPKIQDLIYVGQTQYRTIGEPIGPTQSYADYTKKQNWWKNFANPFHPDILHDKHRLYVSTNSPFTLFQNTADRSKPITEKGLTESTFPLIKKVRYTPYKDKGTANLVYIKPIHTNAEGWEPETDVDLKFEGFPLWCLLWGWEDWVKKLKKLQHMEQDYILVIRTDTMDTKLEEYVILDWTYVNGYSPYQQDYETVDFDQWYPCLTKQMQSIDEICQTGPATCKTSSQSIEAHCDYTFFFKWGGCPNQLENITDPEQQKHYPTPHTIDETIETEDPETPPEHFLYPFDIRRHTITKTAAQRIKTDFKTTIISPTDSKLNSEPTKQALQTFQKEDQTQTTKETKTPLQQQLQLLQQHRIQLQQRINQLISSTPNIKY